MGEQSPLPTPGTAAAIPLQSPLASRAPWGWRNGDNPQATLCLSTSVHDLLASHQPFRALLSAKTWVMGGALGASDGICRAQERKKRAAHVQSHCCHALCADVLRTGNDVPHTGNTWMQASEFWGSPSPAGCASAGPPGGWWGRCLPCTWTVEGLWSEETTESCLFPSSAPRCSAWQGVQALHTRCKTEGRTWPNEKKTFLLLEWLAKCKAIKPLSYREYTPHATSTLLEYVTRDGECAHRIQQSHRGAAGSSWQHRSWHETPEHQWFLCHPLMKPRSNSTSACFICMR